MNWRWLRWELPIFATLVLVGWIISAFVSDAGYVLVAFGRYSLETSIWTGMLLLMLGYLGTRLVFWVLPLLLRPRATWRDWAQTRAATNARSGTDAGLLALAHGDAARARKLLLANASRAPTPLLNFLGAARAAQQMGDGAGRDVDLALAAATAPEAAHAIALTRAQLLIEHGAWEDAHGQLRELQTHLPRNTLVLQLLGRTGVRLRDGESLLAAAPAMRKEKALPEDQIDALEQEAARWCFDDIAAAQDDPSPRWQALPKALQQRPRVIAAYARALGVAGRAVEAERLLRDALDRAWDTTLVRAYGEVAADPAFQLRTVERWLSKHADDAALLQTLGRIHARTGQWLAARSAFEASLRIEQDPAARQRTEQLRREVQAQLPASGLDHAQ